MATPFGDVKQDRQYEFKPFVVPKYNIKFQNITRLSSLSQYVWYTPAPIYLWGRYTDVNLSDIMAEYNLKIYWYKFNKPIFQGLDFKGDPSWNHVLWAADRDVWPKLVDGILESVQFNVDTKVLYNYALQDFVISDPLQADANNLVTAQSDSLKVHAFCPMTNQRQIAFEPKRKSIWELPKICSLPPSKRSLYLSTRLFHNPALKVDNAFDLYKKLLELEASTSYDQKIKDIQARLNNGRVPTS